MGTTVYFGYTLQRLLKERAIEQKEVARATGLTPSAVSRFINGRQAMPKLSTSRRIADLLGLTLDQLWMECVEDTMTDGYAKWYKLRVVDKIYPFSEDKDA